MLFINSIMNSLVRTIYIIVCMKHLSCMFQAAGADRRPQEIRTANERQYM